MFTLVEVQKGSWWHGLTFLHDCLVLKLFMFFWPCLQIILFFYVELKMVADAIIVNYYQQHSNTRYFAIIIASTGTAPLILQIVAHSHCSALLF